MKRYTITIPDDKEKTFIEMMKHIDYIEDIVDDLTYNITEEEKEIVRERIKKYEDSPDCYLSWDDIEKQIGHE
ncbi:MAG TPA: hypothetical protein VE912_20115 [Bacteroidales bacterium]|nr:hypothetical protein [Bacteroidales bacterium]